MLRGLAIVLWAVLAPLCVLAIEVKLTAHWNPPLNVDSFVLILISVVTLLGGASLFRIRTSGSRRVIAFIVYTLFVSPTLLFLFPFFTYSLLDLP